MRTRDAALAVNYGQQARDCACGCGGGCLHTAVKVAARDAVTKWLDAGFDESKHERAANGQFGAGSKVDVHRSTGKKSGRVVSFNKATGRYLIDHGGEHPQSAHHGQVSKPGEKPSGKKESASEAHAISQVRGQFGGAPSTRRNPAPAHGYYKEGARFQK